MLTELLEQWNEESSFSVAVSRVGCRKRGAGSRETSWASVAIVSVDLEWGLQKQKQNIRFEHLPET